MPRPRLTEEEITATRSRILEAALTILHEEGMGALSMRAIAERVGMSPMALYTYFENRDDLLHALREHHRRVLNARYADALARARDGDVVRVTAEVLAGYVSFARRNPHIFRLLWCTQPESTPDDDCPRGRGVQELLEHLAQLIALGIERGVFTERDPLFAARLAFGMIHGPLLLSLVPGAVDASTLEQLETEIVEAAIGYLTVQENG